MCWKVVSILNLSWIRSHLKMSANQFVRNWKSDCKESKLPKSLLSPVTFENVVFGLRWGCFWGGIPYEYDKTKHRISITEKAVRRWTIVTVAQCINFAYFFGVMIVTLLGEESSVTRSKNSMFDTAFGFLITMTHGALIIVDIHVGAFRRTEFCSFVNAAIHYAIFTRENYANRLGTKWRNGCEELMVALRVLMIIIPFLAVTHFLQHPEKAIYATSLIRRDSILYVVAYLGYAVMGLSLLLSGWATIMSIFFPMMGIVFCFISVVEEVKPGKKVYRTKPSFRKPEVLRNTLKIVQLMAILINVIAKQIIMAEQMLVTYTTTVCTVSLIRFWDQLTFSTRWVLVLTVVCVVGIWTTLLTIAAHTYTGAEKGLNSWRNYNNWSPLEKKEMKKYRRSIRPIQLEFGGFYYIRPKKILGFWNTLVWLVVRGLLALPDNHQHHDN